MVQAGETVALRIKLRYQNVDEFVVRYAENVSSAGLFIRTRAPKPPGTRVRFELILSDGDRALRGEGIVVGVQESEPQGMSVRFNVLEPRSEAVVERIVSQSGQGRLAPSPLATEFEGDRGRTGAKVGWGSRRREGVLGHPPGGWVPLSGRGARNRPHTPTDERPASRPVGGVRFRSWALGELAGDSSPSGEIPISVPPTDAFQSGVVKSNFTPEPLFQAKKKVELRAPPTDNIRVLNPPIVAEPTEPNTERLNALTERLNTLKTDAESVNEVPPEHLKGLEPESAEAPSEHLDANLEGTEAPSPEGAEINPLEHLDANLEGTEVEGTEASPPEGTEIHPSEHLDAKVEGTEASPPEGAEIHPSEHLDAKGTEVEGTEASPPEGAEIHPSEHLDANLEGTEASPPEGAEIHPSEHLDANLEGMEINPPEEMEINPPEHLDAYLEGTEILPPDHLSKLKAEERNEAPEEYLSKLRAEAEDIKEAPRDGLSEAVAEDTTKAPQEDLSEITQQNDESTSSEWAPSAVDAETEDPNEAFVAGPEFEAETEKPTNIPSEYKSQEPQAPDSNASEVLEDEEAEVTSGFTEQPSYLELRDLVQSASASEVNETSEAEDSSQEVLEPTEKAKAPIDSDITTRIESNPPTYISKTNPHPFMPEIYVSPAPPPVSDAFTKVLPASAPASEKGPEAIESPQSPVSKELQASELSGSLDDISNLEETDGEADLLGMPSDTRKVSDQDVALDDQLFGPPTQARSESVVDRFLGWLAPDAPETENQEENEEDSVDIYDRTAPGHPPISDHQVIDTNAADDEEEKPLDLVELAVPEVAGAHLGDEIFDNSNIDDTIDSTSLPLEEEAIANALLAFEPSPLTPAILQEPERISKKQESEQATWMDDIEYDQTQEVQALDLPESYPPPIALQTVQPLITSPDEHSSHDLQEEDQDTPLVSPIEDISTPLSPPVEESPKAEQRSDGIRIISGSRITQAQNPARNQRKARPGEVLVTGFDVRAPDKADLAHHRSSERARIRPSAQQRAQRVVLGLLMTDTRLAMGYLEADELELISFQGTTKIPGWVATGVDGELLFGSEAETIAREIPERAVSPYVMLTALSSVGTTRSSTGVRIEEDANGRDLVRLGDWRIEALDVLTALFQSLKACASQHFSHPHFELVISVSSSLGQKALTLLKNAAQAAQFEAVRLEPIPLALIRAHRLEQEPLNAVITVDIGHSNTSVALVRRQSLEIRVIEARNIPDCSLRAVNTAIAETALDAIAQMTGSEDKSEGRIRRRALRAIEALRPEIRWASDLELRFSVAQTEDAPNQVVRVARRQIDESVGPIVLTVSKALQNLLNTHNLPLSAVEAIVIGGVGGFFPPLSTALGSLIGRPPHMSVRPAPAMLLGLIRSAEQHAARPPQHKPPELAASIGLELPGGRFRPVLQAGIKLPVHLVRQFPTARDRQTEVDFRFYQGEGEFVRQCTPLGILRLQGLPKRPKGALTVELDLAVDNDGVLRATLHEPTSGRIGNLETATAQTPSERRNGLQYANHAALGRGPLKKRSLRAAVKRLFGFK